MSVNGIIVPLNGSAGLWEDVATTSLRPKKNRNISVPRGGALAGFSVNENEDMATFTMYNSDEGTVLRMKYADSASSTSSSDYAQVRFETQSDPSGSTYVNLSHIAPPADGYDAANKNYTDTKATKYSYTHTIPVSAWQKQTDGSYKCTRTISGIAETDTPYINLEYQTTTTADQTNEKTEYSKIGRAVTATNSITFTCFSSVPTIALTLNIQGTRGANSTGGSGTLAIANGGTGATTATEARTNLGAAPAYSYGTEDLVAGTSPLAAGTLYFVYE